MLKRIVSSVTALALMAGAVNFSTVIPYNTAPMTASADYVTGPNLGVFEYEGFVYRKFEDHIEIIHGDSEAERVDIPAEIEGLPVTRIGDMAFWWCEKLTEVTIPDTVKIIDWGAFYNCSLRSVVLPDGIEALNGSTFAFNSDLSEVIIPESLTNFSGTDFQGTKWLAKQQAIDTFVVINDILIDGTTCEGDITIPDNVMKISGGAFDYNKNITSVIIPDTVTSVGSAFYACENLTSVTLPDGITEIESNTFASCSKLTDINIPESVTTIGSTAFQRCGFTEFTIPDSVTSIGRAAFATCTKLTSVTIPDSITKISESAFTWCINLTDITIPDSVTDIGHDAFSVCAMTEINLPDGIVSIAENAFSNCDNLTRVTIPASVESIDRFAFFDCPSLSEITILNPKCKLGDSRTTISNNAYTPEYDVEELQYNGVIRGYENSTAQAHAEKFGYTFESLGETVTYTFEELLGMDKSEICAISEHIAEYYEDMQIFYLNYLADYTRYGFYFSMNEWDEKYYIVGENGINDDVVKELIYNDIALPEEIFKFELSGLTPVTGTDENGEKYKDTLISGTFLIHDYYGNPIYEYNDMYVFLRFVVYMDLNPYVRGIGFQRKAGTPSFKAGDVNNDRSIDATDASDVLAEYALIQTGKQGAFTRVQNSVADVNGDGRVDSSDASEILAYYADSLTGKNS